MLLNDSLINNYNTVEITNNGIQLKPYQAIIYKLN